MNEKTYEKMIKILGSHPYALVMIKGINKLTTTLVYFIYPIFLLMLAFNGDLRFWRVFLTPGISFMLVSSFRNHTDFPRPYEVLDIVPIINKSTKGRSFPSRHVFSAFVIAMTLYYISVPVGVILMFAGIILAIVRVLGGVHFPRDVVVGAMIGILFGMIGFRL
ncbi:phosphatase PAP2 family protein [Tissierella carlieri]|uniref:phosphatase PAP2 family protein n=1 Tax=Tissierella carlieri TaxID=689904 RepID=UPI001C10B443|nr:phosphatase PAP2 family protein [Tissierella carlieri]